ncbi:MAG TPA: DUF5939 domain-containing protein [Pyrinomonadaceae bacterium]|nr:DUF5939 domain-containing protein [Pyrinomonadaceae bacterium]
MSRRQREVEYRWEYDLRADPEALWPLVSDTNRFNREMGLPAVADDARAGRVSEAPDSSPPRRRLRARVAGVEVSWEEEPFEWARPFRFGVVRRYTRGPLAELRVRVELQPRERSGTRLAYRFAARPRGTLARAAALLQLKFMRRKFERFLSACDRLAASRPQTVAAAVALDSASRLTPEASARLELIRASLGERGADASLVERLLEVVERGDDLTLARLRPYALADFWRVARRDVLELCLHATRAGLLDFRWDLLCPLCRGPQEAPSSLRDVRPEQHCASCNIDFTVNFDRSVEVTFRPNASVRAVEALEYCAGGPGVTPHVVVQQLVAAGEAREVAARLEEGRYRLRASGRPGARALRVSRGGAARATLRADAEGWPGDELELAAAPSLRFENATEGEQLFVLERTAWSDTAATAAEVTALQLFRDLFAEEALRPGEQISVGQLTLVFTDLRNSTRLYREIGDAVAFGAVMSHFDVLREAIADEGGSIVKTLGDAVMAVFTRPAPALRAVMRAQKQLAAPTTGARPLRLKAGVHTGPCIAVTLNGRLDYFGSNVNIAARLEPLSTGEDCVISEAVRSDPKVAEMLADEARGLSVEPLRTSLKGFDAECFELWRVVGVKETGDEKASEEARSDAAARVT